jgi:uncharacterized membrane protein
VEATSTNFNICLTVHDKNIEIVISVVSASIYLNQLYLFHVEVNHGSELDAVF